MANKEEKLEKLRHIKGYFFISFGISFIFLLVVGMLCIVFNDFYTSVATRLFSIDADDYNEVLMFTLSIWKILVIQFTLIPAIALAVIEKFCTCKK